jgi:putative ABC transport system permease protein
MNLWETFRLAVRAITRHKTRSFLTALGIVIGVAAVIAMVAIGEGAKARVEQAFSAMGTNLLILLPGSTATGGVRGGFGTQASLTWDDLKAIQTEISSVRAAAPTLGTTAQIASDDQNWSTRVTGTTPDYFQVRNWPVASGALFQQSDVDGQTKVIILGQTVVDKLYGPNADPVGLVVRMKNVPFVIVGVAAKKGQSQTGQDYDDAAFIPITTFLTKISGGLRAYLSGPIYIGAISDSATAKAEADITSLLRERHHLADNVDDDFNIRNLSELANAQQESTNTLTALLASIAAVSLLVGGIGIMNIMLVSVTERTREIGLRIAVGAKGRHILLQFLVESLTLSTIGGMIGVLFGLIAAQRLAAKFGWPMLVRADMIIVAVGFSAVVGIVFGLYPARKAAQLDPIDALRYE